MVFLEFIIKIFKNKYQKLKIHKQKFNQKKKKKLPLGDIIEEFIVSDVLNVDTSQLATAAIDGVVAHLQGVGLPVSPFVKIEHVDVAPHGRFFADIAPQRAHLLRGLEDLDRAESLENRLRHVPRELQPVPWNLLFLPHFLSSLFRIIRRRRSTRRRRRRRRRSRLLFLPYFLLRHFRIGIVPEFEFLHLDFGFGAENWNF